MFRLPSFVVASLTVLAVSLHTHAATVIPMLGGAQVAAPMIHVDIFYDYDANAMRVAADTSLGMPVLRPLTAGDEFDPTAPWGVLSGKAYNAQYGWNPGGYFVLPEGASIWIKLITKSEGLEVYEGRKNKGTYAPSFGTGGSSRIWKWSGAMVHFTHAFLNPRETVYSATYKVYFGDTTTGEPIAGYDSETVTLQWAVRSDDLSLAWNPNPIEGSIQDIRRVKALSWSAGDQSVLHRIYLVVHHS